jgi:predicted TIM-barrel enzyme|tara:strand:+ start:16911 stop:17081 length:171 start_codon:yes stop_codon:yes gene_type:complete
VGAGVNLKNAYEQMSVCDGAIIGSAFKRKKDTRSPVDRELVRNLMGEVRRARIDST